MFPLCFSFYYFHLDPSRKTTTSPHPSLPHSLFCDDKIFTDLTLFQTIQQDVHRRLLVNASCVFYLLSISSKHLTLIYIVLRPPYHVETNTDIIICFFYYSCNFSELELKDLLSPQHFVWNSILSQFVRFRATILVTLNKHTLSLSLRLH